MNEYRDAGKLFSYTILFILFTSLLGIGSGTDNYIISLAVSQLCLALPAVVYLINKKTDITKRMGLCKVKPVPVIASVVMGFSVIPFISMINSISMLFVKNVTESKVTVTAEKYPMWIMLLTVALMPALIEEILYRGIYFGVYRKSGIIKGALVAAILFALMHGNLNQFAYAIVAGFMFAMIDYAGGSVIYSIIMHVIINGVSVVSLYADKLNSELVHKLAEEKVYNSIMEVIVDLGPMATAGLIITGIGYMIIRKFGNTYEEETGSGSVMNVYLGVGVVIMVINFIANEMM